MHVARKDVEAPTRDELVIEHLDVVRSTANRLARRLPPSVETKDLISIGMLGLIDAAGRYRPWLGVPFDAFARRRVLGAMLEPHPVVAPAAGNTAARTPGKKAPGRNLTTDRKSKSSDPGLVIKKVLFPQY